MSDTQTATVATAAPVPATEPAKQTFTAEEVDRMKANWSENISRHESKAAKELETLKAKLAKEKEEADRKNMTDLERERADKAALEAKLRDVEQRQSRIVIESEIKLVGLREGANDVSDLMALVPRDGITMDENGNVTGIEDAVKALKERKPYLFASAAAPTKPAGNQPPNSASPQKPKLVGVSPLDMALERQQRNARIFGGAGA